MSNAKAPTTRFVDRGPEHFYAGISQRHYVYMEPGAMRIPALLVAVVALIVVALARWL